MQKIVLFVFLLFVAETAFAQKTYIQCGKLIDGASPAAQTQITIVVEGKTIVDIQKGIHQEPLQTRLLTCKTKR